MPCRVFEALACWIEPYVTTSPCPGCGDVRPGPSGPASLPFLSVLRRVCSTSAPLPRGSSRGLPLPAAAGRRPNPFAPAPVPAAGATPAGGARAVARSPAGPPGSPPSVSPPVATPPAGVGCWQVCPSSFFSCSFFSRSLASFNLRLISSRTNSRLNLASSSSGSRSRACL